MIECGCIYSIGHVDDKANKLHAIASLRVLLDATKEQTVVNGRDTTNEEVSGFFCPIQLIVNNFHTVLYSQLL